MDETTYAGNQKYSNSAKVEGHSVFKQCLARKHVFVTDMLSFDGLKYG